MEKFQNLDDYGLLITEYIIIDFFFFLISHPSSCCAFSLSTTLSVCAVKRLPHVSGGGLNLKELKQGSHIIKERSVPRHKLLFFPSHFHITKVPQASWSFY